MNALLKSLLSLLPLTCLAFPAGPSSAATDDSLAEALPILQAHYADFKALNYQPGDRLSDLIARSKGGINLGAPEIAPATPPLTTAILPDRILYLRLSSQLPKTVTAELATELQAATTQDGSNGVVLDLRSDTGPDDMAAAAQVLAYLAPGDDSLVKFRPEPSPANPSAHPEHSFHGPLIVLVNHETSGAAEIVAALLKADGALLMGRETSGKGAVWEQQKLTSGKMLNYVAAHVALADGADLWNRPVAPDIALNVDDHNEKAALILIRDNQILDVIGESPERHRMSEAALVQGQDPEWDDYLAALERKPVLLSLPVIHDAVLISALDSLKAIRLSERALPTTAGLDAANPASSSVQ